jgi:hypothetical protein
MNAAAPRASQRARTIALIVAAYVLLAVAYTWPLPLRLATGVAHDVGDPLLNTWILWWSSQAMPLTARWWNAPFFYPAPGVLAFSEHLLGLAPIAVPLVLLTRAPLVGYNVALVVTFAASGLGAHFLGYTLTRRHDAGFVAGLAFAFAPYRLAQVPHIQVLASYWAPICLAALHRYIDSGSRRWAVLAATAWFMQALSCGYYFFFLSTLLALWIAWFAAGRISLRRFATIALMFAIAAVLLLPVLKGYQTILHDTYGKTRSMDEIHTFSADIAGLLTAPDELLTWGWLHATDRAESTLFPGVTVVALIVMGLIVVRLLNREAREPRWLSRVRIGSALAFLVFALATVIPIVHGTWRVTVGGFRLLSVSQSDQPMILGLIAALLCALTFPRIRAALRQRSVMAFYVLAAGVMWICALGPDPAMNGIQVFSQSIYSWLMALPGFGGLRVPARFWMMALVCTSAACAIAIGHLRGRVRTTIVVCAVAGLLLDGWPREFTVMGAPAPRPCPSGVETCLYLPVGDDDPMAMYRQMWDLKPLYNGYSGYFPPHYYAMRSLLLQRDSRVLHALAAGGTLGIVVDHAQDTDSAIRNWILTIPGAVRAHDGSDWSSYRVPRTADVILPDRAGDVIPIKSLDARPSPPHAPRALDGDLTTRWSGGPQQQSAELVVELERPERVAQVVLELGEFFTDFPMRLEIEVSLDGRSWRSVWLGDTALHAYFGALRHPREMPLVFPIDAGNVRFIRLTQKGFGAHDWSVAELQILK